MPPVTIWGLSDSDTHELVGCVLVCWRWDTPHLPGRPVLIMDVCSVSILDSLVAILDSHFYVSALILVCKFQYWDSYKIGPAGQASFMTQESYWVAGIDNGVPVM